MVVVGNFLSFFSNENFLKFIMTVIDNFSFFFYSINVGIFGYNRYHTHGGRVNFFSKKSHALPLG
jgi:hypothetical protein